MIARVGRAGWMMGIGMLATMVHGAVWGQAPDQSASPEAQALLAQLDEQDVYERQKAFVRLEALRDPATIPVLRDSLRHRDADTRAFSVRALAAVAGASSAPALIERLRDDRDPDVRLAVILALEPFHGQDPAIDRALIDAMRDRNSYVRMAAVDVVSRIDQPEAKEALRVRSRRERHRDVRRVLEQAMTRAGLAQ